MACRRALDQLQITVADEVEVAHRRPSPGGHSHAGVRVERDDHRLVRLQFDAVDRADAHTCHAHRFPGLEAGRVGENRRIVLRRAGLVLAEDEEQATR